TLLIVAPFSISANNLPRTDSLETIDSTSYDKTTIKDEKGNEVLFVSRFDLFIESINNAIPDTALFYDWITDDIHRRKFDFSKVQDSIVLLLNKVNDFYTHPFNGKITSEFGSRKSRYHYGTDIKLETGDTVRCAFNGKVRISTYSKTYGNVVVVRHDNGLETIYGHLSKRLVDVDSTISSGTVLGLGGNTGRSYGSHLHFEIRYFDEALDPRDVVAFENFSLLHDTLFISQCNFVYRDEIKELTKMQYHKVSRGNTLGHIAQKYGTSITAICKMNGISRNKLLQIGENLRVR
ncbi:MAG: hypothetical protein A3K10_03395, partial [Bacteroidetes bacterium RIFCSPLOWO2_12_FULL_31_6]